MSTSSNYPRSVQVTVHLEAIAHNYQLLRARAQSPAFAVIKADAYGHGIYAVANHLADIADGFAVVTVGEAIAVRDAGVARPVLVLQGPQDETDVEAIIAHGFWPALHDEAQIAMVQAHPLAAQLEPWLKVDTGMGRLGVALDAVPHHLNSSDLRWRGVLSHLASADAPSNPFTDEQAARFDALLQDYEFESSLANTAAALAWPSTRRHWARVGIGLYGSHPVEHHTDAEDLLKPAMTVQAPLIAVRTIAAGQTVGYSETYRCDTATLVGYAAIGYADGLPRVLDASADVLVQGMRCPIIGRVSMDSIAIDLSALAEPPALGDRVTVWGPGQPVDRLAAAAGTISYELMTQVTGRRTYSD